MSSIDWIDVGFYFLRHGESQNNRMDRVNGWTDSQLTDRGEAQARSAAKILAKHPIRRIVSSDLQRAHQTAEIVAKSLGQLPVEIFPELRERNWGIYENQPRAQRPPLYEVPEGGEGPREYHQRLEQAIRIIQPDWHTLVVGHAGTMRVLREMLGLKEESTRLPNSSPVRIYMAPKPCMEFI